jgi:hypothetical protein
MVEQEQFQAQQHQPMDRLLDLGGFFHFNHE